MATLSPQTRLMRVGIFVAMGMVVAGVLVFIIGDERHMFESKSSMRTSFRDVGGLRVGSPVRMAGIDVGQVTSIRFGEDARDSLMHVEFNMINSALRRVRANSRARIISKGLLGDKALEITVGDPAQPAIAAGGLVPSEEADDLANALRNATTLLDRANSVMDNIANATRPLGNDRLANDLLGMIRDLRTIMSHVANGNGTVSRLLRDQTVANRIEGTLGSAESTMRNLNGAAAQINALARDARTGRGLLHALIYDESGGRSVRSLGNAADELASIVRDVRTGSGGLHEIIYGRDSAQVIRNVNEATASLRDIMRDVQRGRGTLGALLVDPSLYEDVRNLVGNVQRNEILRALVRYSIRADEQRGTQRATPAPAPPPPPSPAP